MAETMAYTAHDPEAFYSAIVTRLETSTTKNVGLATAPEVSVDAKGRITDPYQIVYPLRETYDGSLSDPSQINVWRFQVTCVGRDARQAQWMQHAARTALLGWIPTVAGLGTTAIRTVDGSDIGEDRDFQPHRFFSTDRFEIFTS